MKDFAAEGFRKVSGRIPEGSGPSALSFPNSERFLQKVFAEGSVESFCGRFCGRFPEGFSRKVQKLVSSINIVILIFNCFELEQKWQWANKKKKHPHFML